MFFFMRKINDNKNLDHLFDEFYAIKNAEGKADSTLRHYKDNYSYFVAFLDRCKIDRDGIRSPSRLMLSLAKHLPGGAIKGLTQ